MSDIVNEDEKDNDDNDNDENETFQDSMLEKSHTKVKQSCWLRATPLLLVLN